MDDTPTGKNVARFRLPPSVAQRRIREVSIESGNLKWSLHAHRRMNEREIFDADVLRILRLGVICGDPEETPVGEWKCKMTLRLRGTREAGVIVIILRGGKLQIKTVEWEDLP